MHIVSIYDEHSMMYIHVCRCVLLHSCIYRVGVSKGGLTAAALIVFSM